MWHVQRTQLNRMQLPCPNLDGILSRAAICHSRASTTCAWAFWFIRNMLYPSSWKARVYIYNFYARNINLNIHSISPISHSTSSISFYCILMIFYSNIILALWKNIRSHHRYCCAYSWRLYASELELIELRFPSPTGFLGQCELSLSYESEWAIEPSSNESCRMKNLFCAKMSRGTD